jgi:L-aminopeptidase/D-esterase-like protein
MRKGLTDIAGIRVGHWTHENARTGCTVVLFPDGTITSGEVRGSAPATREFALLSPERTVPGIHAALLTGGSAFGLAAADGVVRWLEERGVGFVTPVAAIPVVSALACFDLAVGDPRVRPGAPEGYAACEDASSEERGRGQVGAGTGCTVGKWHGLALQRPSGLGAATLHHEGLLVSALVAVNAVGFPGRAQELRAPFWSGGMNTTIGVLATNAVMSKMGCYLLAQSGHDGLARAIDPVHTGLDGDALISAATCQVEADLDLVRALGARVVTQAVDSAIDSSDWGSGDGGG